MNHRFVIAILVAGCGANTAGLKAQAASDMSCKEEDVDTNQVTNGYKGDDFGARFEVECGEEKRLYEKKGPGNWAEVEQTEVMPEPASGEGEGEGEGDEGETEPSEDE